jgi:hypothetical protein
MEPAEVIGSATGIAGTILSIVDQLSAKEGFSYALCSFPLKYSVEKKPDQAQQSASAAGADNSQAASANPAAGSESTSPPSATKSGASQHKVPAAMKDRPVVLEVQLISVYTEPWMPNPFDWRLPTAPKQTKSIKAHVVLTIQGTRTASAVMCVVVLAKLEGFNTKIGDQMTVDFVATELPEGVLLVIKGFVDPGLSGYAHFLGRVFVSLDKSGSSIVTKPIGQLELAPSDSNFKPESTSSGFRLTFSS